MEPPGRSCRSRNQQITIKLLQQNGPDILHNKILGRSRNDWKKPENRGADPHSTRTSVFGKPLNFREVLILRVV